MGTVEGKSVIVEVTPTIEAAAYAAGDDLGDCKELANALDDYKGTGSIMSVVIIDKAKQKAAIDVLFFDENPTIASSENAALDISDAEMADKFLGRVSVAAADYQDLSGCSEATITSVGLLIQGRTRRSNSIWMQLCSRGAPTYASTSDLTVKVGIVQD